MLQKLSGYLIGLSFILSGVACDNAGSVVGQEGRQAIVTSAVSPEPCEAALVSRETKERQDRARPIEAECKECTGTTLNLGLANPPAGMGPATGSSTISVGDCVSQLDAVFDDFCTLQNLPSDCAGKCKNSLSCKGFGGARNVGVHVQPTGSSTCSSNRFFCSCKCR